MNQQIKKHHRIIKLTNDCTFPETNIAPKSWMFGRQSFYLEVLVALPWLISEPWRLRGMFEAFVGLN